MMESVVVIVSADVEWRVLRDILSVQPTGRTPYGECCELQVNVQGQPTQVTYVHGGWGKFSAAGSAQYAIERWSPDLIINIGTCGGILEQIEVGEIVLAERTLVYDIIEQMFDAKEAVEHYATDLDLSWLREPYPHPVKRTPLLSADRDGLAEQIDFLKDEYSATALDWESGAIAWIAAKNQKRCLILRGVTDLVDSSGGEAYDGTGELFSKRTDDIMRTLMESLPSWIECSTPAASSSPRGKAGDLAS